MKIIDLDVDAFLSGDTKIEEIGLVFNPAIEVDWVYFNSSEQQFESYDDYPQGASDAACKAVRWAEENGWGDCLEGPGKQRAHQLCNREKISEQTIARMSSFARHLQYEDVPYDEGCGGLAVDSWGARIGIEWAQRKLKQIREEKMASQCGCSINHNFVDSAQGISVGDYVSWTYGGRSEGDDRARGQVKEIRVQGEVSIPDTDLTLTATEEKPVALIETRDGRVVGQYIDGDMRVIQKPEDFSHSEIKAMIEAQRLGCKGIHRMGDEWHPCGTHEEYQNALTYAGMRLIDDEMVQGIADLLLQVEDIENRAKMAIEVLKDFEEENIYIDYEVFLEMIGLGGPDLSYLWDDTMELEDLLAEGYEIVGYREINPAEITDEYKQFTKENLTEEQFYKLVSYPNEPSLLDSKFRLRRYVYAIGPQGGPNLIPTSREFCRKMMGKRQLVWRYEDIQMLSAQLNGEDRDRKIIPRPKGASVDVFTYAGGANCLHRFLELSLDPGKKIVNNAQISKKKADYVLDAPGQAGKVNEGVQYGRERDPQTLRQESMNYDTNGLEPYTREDDEDMLLKDLPIGFLQGVPVYNSEKEAQSKSTAMGCEGVYEKVEYMDQEAFRPCRARANNEFSSQEFEFRTDDEKRMIYAPAMVPNKLMRRWEPEEGEYWVRFSKEAIERASHKFLAEGRTSPEFVNYEHSETKFDDIYLVESWIVGSTEDKIYEYGYTRDQVPEGSWVVGYKVNNDDLWENYVKKGLIKAVSVEGLFDMSFNAEKTDEYLLSEVINLLNQVD